MESPNVSNTDQVVVNGDVVAAAVAPTDNTDPNWVDSDEFVLENHLTALVVDDSKMDRMIHHALLVKLGVESWEVEDGRDAIELIVDFGMVFDLILMDMDMRVLDGPSTTRILRGMGVDSVIVGVSSRDQSDKKDFMKSGLDDYHEKPLTRAKLISLLREIDDNRRFGLTNDRRTPICSVDVLLDL